MPQRQKPDSAPKPVPSPKGKKEPNKGPTPMDQSKPGKPGNQNESQFNMGKALVIERPQNGTEFLLLITVCFGSIII